MNTPGMHNTIAPWHRESFDRFIERGLPELLAQRVPFEGCVIEPSGAYTCTLHVALGPRAGGIELDIPDVPRPDDDGVFEIKGRRFVVPPLASDEALDQAQVRCVGEQLLEYIAERLGEAPADLGWDEELARMWLPIDTWVRQLVLEKEPLEERNWLARAEHLRRIIVAPPEHLRGTRPPSPERSMRALCLPPSPSGCFIGGRLATCVRSIPHTASASPKCSVSRAARRSVTGESCASMKTPRPRTIRVRCSASPRR